MELNYIKTYGPVIILAVWMLFILKEKSFKLAGATLFFASYAACSQNFIFLYRELHQAIQAVMMFIGVMGALYDGRLFRFNILFVTLLGFIGISLIFPPFDEDAQTNLITLLASIGVVNFLYRSCSSMNYFEKIIQFVGDLSITVALLGIVELISNPGVRVVATMSNPNYLGYFLSLGFCIVNSRVSSFHRTLALSVLVLGILATGSRSALVIPFIQMITSAYNPPRARKAIFYSAIGIVAAIAITQTNVSRFTDIDQSEASDAERVIFTNIALRMAMEHPLTGVGWGRFATEFGDYSLATEKISTKAGIVDASLQDRRVTHNDFLRIMAELGWIAFLASIAICISGIVKISGQNYISRNYIYGTWGGTILYSVAHNNLNGAIFWFFFLMPFFLASNQRVKIDLPAATRTNMKKRSLSNYEE